MRTIIVLAAIALSACGGEGRMASEEEKAVADEYGTVCMQKGFTYDSCFQLCRDEFKSARTWGVTEACQSAARKKLIERGPQ